jgi:PAS domain S-box-containing protein
MGFTVTGLVARLLLLVSMALLPVLGFEIYAERDARQVRQQLMEDEALRLVRLVASEQQRIVDSAEQVLDVLASTPAVQDNRLPQCQRILGNFLRQSPRYANVFVNGLDGHLVCGPAPVDPSITIADREYFRDALSTGGFTVGTYGIGRVIRRPAIALVRPFTNGDGVVMGVVGVALDLNWLQQELERLPLPPGSVASIVDRNGTILARIPAAPGYVGGPIIDAVRFSLEGNQIAVTHSTSRDGRPRIMAYSPPGANLGGLASMVGLDRDLAFTSITRANRTGIVLIIAGGVLALLITALAGTRLIRHPFHRLLAVADRWRTGDLAARSRVRKDTSEFGRLGAAFDAMAAALQAREHALSMALESTTDNVMVLDRAGRVTFLNERAKAAIGRDRDLLGQVIWEAFPALADNAIGAALRRAVEQGAPTYASATSPTFGKDFEAHAYPSSDGLTMFFRDVTEERRTAAALLESERHFRAIFEQAAVGMAEVAMDGSWLRVNGRMCAIIGRTQDDLLGRTFQDVTWPDDLEGDLALRSALVAGEVDTIAREKRYLRGDGSTVWVNLTIALLRDSDGKPDRFISVIEDISGRKRIEEALQANEALLRAVLEQIPAAVIISKLPEGRVTVRSRHSEIILGPLAGSLEAPPAAAGRQGVHSDGRFYALEDYASWRALHRGETVMAEPMIYRRADGELMDLEIYAAPVRDATGAIIAAVTAAFDVSERNRAKNLLDQANANLEARVREEVAARQAAQARAAHAERMQALGQLAGGIAHDFNNVLQAVEGAAALIERRPQDETAVHRLARLVIEAAGRGASITRRLLAFGRRSDLRAEALDVAAMLAGMREVFAYTLGPAIDVDVGAVDDVPPILADRGQLETALINLATNARDAMRDGGRLMLTAALEVVPVDGLLHPFALAPGRYVRLTVADTGTGMDAATLARAAEPFFTTKAVGLGTGLGLPMVRGFAEQSGGALNIASIPGHGTTVTLWLPVAGADQRPDTAAPQAAGRVPADDQGKTTIPTRVLLVDDEDLLREVLAEQLGDAGYHVLVAASGADALALLAKGEAVDILITDLSMPGMDGLAVIRAAQEGRPRLPAVLLTGYAGDGAALAVGGAVSGSFSLLRKPVRLQDLVDRIQSLLAARTNVANPPAR